MNETVTVKGMVFEPYLTRDMIAGEVKRVAAEIRRDVGDRKPLFLCVLNGAFMFAADLLREVGIDEAYIRFVRYASYSGTQSTGEVKQILGLDTEVEGRDIVVIEDIVDTGRTALKMVENLRARKPASIRFATLLYKPESSVNGFVPDYVAFSIPSKFILGYGLDLDGLGRNLPDIYVKKD